MASAVSEQDLNSEVELLASPYLVRQALLGVPERQRSAIAELAGKLAALWSLPNAGYAALHQMPDVTPQDEWAARIERDLNASVIKRSNVIEVDFRSHDPQWSRVFLERLLNRYLELHARISHDPQAEKFFEVQRRLLQQRLNGSEERLRGAQMQTGISQVAEQQQALITQLYAAQADYRKTSAQLNAALEQIANLEGQLARTPARQSKESKVVQNLALQQLKPQVLQMEAERAELLSRYRPTSARISEIDAKLAAARKILDRENRSEVQETTSDINPTWSTLDSDLAESRSEAAGLKATVLAQAAQVKALNDQLKNLASAGVDIARLQLQVDTDRQAYLSYVRKGEEARAADALNRSRILNVTVVEDPLTPLEPVSPKLALNLIAGFLLAMVLAVGAAHWAETHDPRICSIAAIAELSGLPAAAVINDRL
jgi:tyrosine-protein kinase Etk/Wzc